MHKASLDQFADISLLPHDGGALAIALREPLPHVFTPHTGCPAGATQDCMAKGVMLHLNFPDPQDQLATAWWSLRRVLTAKQIHEQPDGYPIRFDHDPSLSREAYTLTIEPQGASVTASDVDGLRRGVYFLEDRISEAQGPSATAGRWLRRPVVKHRISRCFFGPTNREPFFIDELMNDVDYYPDEYLNKLAHEGINGLWLSMYFRDLPSSIFPNRGVNAPKRLAKLRQTVERCRRFGIRIYIYTSEPKRYGPGTWSVPVSDAKDACPLTIGQPMDDFFTFCTSTPQGQQYLAESVSQIFSAVPDLGGLINIMYNEDNGCCASFMLRDRFHTNHPQGKLQCPRCSQHDPAQLLANQAQLMADAMHQASPDAEFIGWIYAPDQRDHSSLSDKLAHIADVWPQNCTLMYNFESGGQQTQLGKQRVIFDYSLAFIGPSALYQRIASQVPKAGAKLQVGCSHENAAIPFMPVPGNLYEKYKTLHQHQVGVAMQCWYFGNYPGLMNKAAGELSFEPLPESESDFLHGLARPDWRNHADQVVKAWQCFARGYKQFPSNLAFAWYGPLHNAIAWPWHLTPTDTPIAPSWILKQFPRVSGDRIGECLAYYHTLPESLELCESMYRHWQEGVDLLLPLRDFFETDAARLADIDLAQAIALQMRSTRNLLKFYFLREQMLHEHINHLGPLEALVRDEIIATQQMLTLCERDKRLGYHSEAEGYVFFPEKLMARVELLNKLLAEDFPSFDLSASWVDEYTGQCLTGAVMACGARERRDRQPVGASGMTWSASHHEGELTLHIENALGHDWLLEIEPCRLWPALRVDVNKQGQGQMFDYVLREIPEWTCAVQDDDVVLTLPLSIFDGFHREGFPMRINVSTSQGEGWVTRHAWPMRLLHQDYNPASMGWLVFE